MKPGIGDRGHGYNVLVCFPQFAYLYFMVLEFSIVLSGHPERERAGEKVSHLS